MQETELNDLSDDADYAASQLHVFPHPPLSSLFLATCSSWCRIHFLTSMILVETTTFLGQGSVYMMRSDSTKTSSSADPEGAEVVYLKDNVTIHPTQFASERISGRLKLIKQGSSLFMVFSLFNLCIPGSCFLEWIAPDNQFPIPSKPPDNNN